jgi:hypothetical protein
MFSTEHDIVEDMNQLIDEHFQLYDMFSSLWRLTLFLRSIRAFVQAQSKTRVIINMGIETMILTCHIVENESWSTQESMVEPDNGTVMIRIRDRLVDDYRHVRLDLAQRRILSATITLIDSMTYH